MIIFKRKIFSILTVFILIVFILMLLLATSLIKDIKKSSQEFVLERKTLSLLEGQFQKFEDFEENSAFYQSNLEKLGKLFLNPEVPVDLIQFSFPLF
jgi:lipopolysaccharide/colanic/teichoic acid biosynthesis glycosyltransferase